MVRALGKIGRMIGGMIHNIKAYIKFLWKSTNHHGIHSPFVYKLFTECIYDAKNYPEYEILDRHRKHLLSDTTKLEVQDFGAGSRVFKGNVRIVKDIAKNAGISRKRARMLLRVVRYFSPDEILEIGTSVGLGTAALAVGANTAKVLSVEGCKNTSAIAKDGFSKVEIGNVEIVNSEFNTFLSGYKKSATERQLIYFDGNHSKSATLNYFNTLLPLAGNDDIWIFDDIHWSPGMEQAWEEIKSCDKISVAIDTFQWGMVFFRRQQNKEDFVVRA